MCAVILGGWGNCYTFFAFTSQAPLSFALLMKFVTSDPKYLIGIISKANNVTKTLQTFVLWPWEAKTGLDTSSSGLNSFPRHCLKGSTRLQQPCMLIPRKIHNFFCI